MHHRVTYMYINFQQIRVSGSVKTVLINIIANNHKLHKFATTNSNFEKKRLIQICVIVKRSCILIFSKLGLVDQSKPCTQIYLQKIANCINLQRAIRILKNQAFRTCTTLYRTFRPILRSIGLLDIELPQKEIISTDDRRTDRQTDRRTDGQTSLTTTMKLLDLNLFCLFCLSRFL